MDFYSITRLRMILMETLVVLILSFLIPGECVSILFYCRRSFVKFNDRTMIEDVHIPFIIIIFFAFIIKYLFKYPCNMKQN